MPELPAYLWAYTALIIAILLGWLVVSVLIERHRRKFLVDLMSTHPVCSNKQARFRSYIGR